MIPFSYPEYLRRLKIHGEVITMTRMKSNGDAEHFILKEEEVLLKELHNDKQELR